MSVNVKGCLQQRRVNYVCYINLLIKLIYFYVLSVCPINGKLQVAYVTLLLQSNFSHDLSDKGKSNTLIGEGISSHLFCC